ncbi:MAG: T9SS type A sorting domain-containing protein [candidate division WOR-3 bacterium]
MRSKLCLIFLVPVIVFAGYQSEVVTVEGAVPIDRIATKKVAPPNNKPFTVTVGWVDTIGGTTYDWLANGPSYRWLVNSPAYGLHAGWMASSEPGSPWSDRNMRYNFYDYGTGSWVWIDPDFMASGVGVFTIRSGYGNVDADPVTGIAVFSAHQNPNQQWRPVLARDMAPGAGIFEYCDGAPNALHYLWPPISIDANQVIHCALIDSFTRNTTFDIYYTKVATWCNWETPIHIPPPQPDPSAQDQSIAASKVSQKVCITWVYSPSGYNDDPGFYRISNDGGATWDAPRVLEDPPAYGQDTVPSFHIASLFPFFDSQDRLHIVAHVTPFVRDTNWILPAEIWHWCQNNNPQWSRIHRADAESLAAGVGYNASLACRPSIGEDNQGNLYVAWEEFDPLNADPVTSLLRANIYAAKSADGGNTWTSAKKLTDAGNASCRFPSIADKMVETGEAIYVPIIYEIDQQAGFVVQSQGTSTNNPVVVQWVPADYFDGVAEQSKQGANRIELTAVPNPFTNRTLISYALPKDGAVSINLYDITGRPVETLVQGHKSAGYHSVTLNSGQLPAGVYFCTLKAGGSSLTKRLTIVR